MKKINALHGQGFAHPVASQHDISDYLWLIKQIYGCNGLCGCVPACPCMRQTMMQG